MQRHQPLTYAWSLTNLYLEVPSNGEEQRLRHRERFIIEFGRQLPQRKDLRIKPSSGLDTFLRSAEKLAAIADSGMNQRQVEEIRNAVRDRLTAAATLLRKEIVARGEDKLSLPAPGRPLLVADYGSRRASIIKERLELQEPADLLELSAVTQRAALGEGRFTMAERRAAAAGHDLISTVAGQRGIELPQIVPAAVRRLSKRNQHER